MKAISAMANINEGKLFVGCNDLGNLFELENIKKLLENGIIEKTGTRDKGTYYVLMNNKEAIKKDFVHAYYTKE